MNRLPLVLALVVISAGIGVPGVEPIAGAPLTLAQSEQFFPDTIGSRWRFRGSVVEGPLEKIAIKSFVNVSTVVRTDTIKGVTVKVFHDSNPGNHGPSDSFYRRDAAGIIYYGSEPGTTLEKQLIPYQIIRFPIVIPSTFEQFDKSILDFGSDLDGDEQNEKADVAATVTIQTQEPITVPAGTYQDGVRIEARMTMRIRLSASQRIVVGTDTMTAWFVRGIGLVKYVERQEMPPLRTEHGLVAEITEELEEYEIKKETASFLGSEPPAQRVLTHDAGRHELSQIFRPSRLRPHP